MRCLRLGSVRLCAGEVVAGVKSTSWRNYHRPAVLPILPARTRGNIAARNREMQKIAPLLGLEFRPLNAAGEVAEARR